MGDCDDDVVVDDDYDVYVDLEKSGVEKECVGEKEFGLSSTMVLDERPNGSNTLHYWVLLQMTLFQTHLNDE